MAEYFVAHTPDLRCYPNYSFAMGDVDGDGRMEMAALSQNGNRLRVVDLEGRTVCERKVVNHGNWGTPLICCADLDGDGCDEVIAPGFGKRFEARIAAFDGGGNQVGEHLFGTGDRDDYGIGVPLLARARLSRDGSPCLVAAVAGGRIVALDSRLRELWRVEGMRHDFGHEFHVADLDGDGLDEVAFCTLDHISGGYSEDEWNRGELVVLDHDGTVLLRQRVDRYCRDTHFDDVAMGDFRRLGQPEILVEKGLLLDLDGEVIWDVSDRFDHGQWIACTPDRRARGRRIFISELWSTAGKGGLFSGDGEPRMEVGGLPGSRLDGDRFAEWRVLPTRCHFVRWTRDAEPEVFFAEQTCSPTSHDCFATVEFGLRAFFLDLEGTLVGTLPFRDAQVEGYWYNGEVHSLVADVDGDGQQEVVFPRQDGRVMIIKRDL